MSFEWIERQYRKRFRQGMIVRLSNGRLGVVTKADHYVYVRVNGERHAAPYHPGDVDPAEPTVPESV